MPVNTQEACSDIQSVEQNDDIKKSRRTMRGILSNCILSVPYHTIKGYLSAIIASYSGCDFTFHFYEIIIIRIEPMAFIMMIGICMWRMVKSMMFILDLKEVTLFITYMMLEISCGGLGQKRLD